jgi:hypothetical protein
LVSAVCLHLITDGVTPLFDGFNNLFNDRGVDNFSCWGKGILNGSSHYWGMGQMMKQKKWREISKWFVHGEKISVCDDSNSILFGLSRPQFWNRHNFCFHEKKIKLCVVSTLNFFFLKKTSFPHLKTKQSKTFQDIYEKKAPCANKILAFDTKKNGTRIFGQAFIKSA